MFIVHRLIVGTLMVGFLASSNAEATSLFSDADPLFYRLVNEGVRKPLPAERMEELTPVLKDAQARVDSLALGCEPTAVAEVHLSQPDASLAASGVELDFACEDGPAPSVGLYYSLDYKYLGISAHGQ